MTDFPSNFFFDEVETSEFFSEFGTRISWVDPSGSLRGTDETPVYALVDSTITVDRDDLSALIQVHSTIMRVKTKDGKQMRNNSSILIGDENWQPKMNAAERIDDGSIMMIPIERTT